MKIVVIGSIAAGVSAAQQIAGGDKSARITVYEKGAFYSYFRNFLYPILKLLQFSSSRKG